MAIGMGSSVVDVGVAITLQNRFSQEAGRISQDFRNLMTEANLYSRGINQGSATLTGLAGNVLQGLGQAFIYSSKVTGEVWRAGQIAGASAVEQTQLLQKAFEVNRLTPISAMEAASAERYLAMAGNTSKQIQDMLQPAAELGSILGTQIGGKGGVADLMTNIMATYGIESAKAAAVTDDLYTAVTNSNMSLEDLAQSITYAGSYAQVAGISLRETAAAIGVMGNQGIQGSRAGVALANMFNYLMQSVSGYRTKGFNALQEWGISKEDLLDSEGKLKSLKNTMIVLSRVMSQMTRDQQIEFLANVMQVRATRATVALYNDMFRDISQGGQTFDKIMVRYNQNQGIVHKKTLEYLNTTQGAIDELTSTWENLIVVVGNAFAPWVPIIRGVSSVLQGIVNMFQSGNNPVLRFLLQWSVMASAIGLLVNFFRTIKNTLSMINGLATAFNAKTGTMNKAVSSVNTQFAAMEAHLISILRMMGQMVYLQGRMMGFSFNMGKNGKVTIRDNKGRIRGNWGTQMGDILAGTMMAGAAAAGAAAGSSSAAGTATRAAAIGAGVFGTGMTRTGLARGLLRVGVNRGVAMGILRGVGAIGGTLGKFMGPIGWIASLALPFVMDGISKLISNTSETAANTSNLNSSNSGQIPSMLGTSVFTPSRVFNSGNVNQAMMVASGMTRKQNDDIRVRLYVNNKDLGQIADMASFDLDLMGIDPLSTTF